MSQLTWIERMTARASFGSNRCCSKLYYIAATITLSTAALPCGVTVPPRCHLPCCRQPRSHQSHCFPAPPACLLLPPCGRYRADAHCKAISRAAVCYSLSPSSRPFPAIRTTARSMAGLHDKEGYYLNIIFLPSKSSPILDVHAQSYNYRDSCTYI